MKMFPTVRNLETAFQTTRRISIIVIVSCTLLSGLVVWESYRSAARAREQVYILASGKVLEAFAGERKDNLPVEARDHIKTFHQHFFSLGPDEKLINDNISRALYLADESAKKLYENLRENGYYSGIISGNISQEIAVDSIQLAMDNYPWYFRCYATQKIIRVTSVVTRSLVTEGWLRSIQRSDNNPHGFLIERLNTVVNKDLKVEQR